MRIGIDSLALFEGKKGTPKSSRGTKMEGTNMKKEKKKKISFRSRSAASALPAYKESNCGAAVFSGDNFRRLKRTALIN